MVTESFVAAVDGMGVAAVEESAGVRSIVTSEDLGDRSLWL